MKDKNLPNDYNALSLEELTNEANKMIEDLENQKDLDNSIENYQNEIYRFSQPFPNSYAHLLEDQSISKNLHVYV